MARLPRRAALALWLAFGAAASVAAGGLATADDGERVRLDYRADPGCPGKDAFVARVLARTTSARFVDEGAEGRTFSVWLVGGAHPSGSLTILDRASPEAARRLEASTCEEVADALALMVALAIAPPAPPSAPPDASSVATADASEPDADASPAPPTLDASAPEAEERAIPPLPEELPGTDQPPLPQGPPRVKHLFAGADFAVATDVTPTTLFAGAPYIGWRDPRAALLRPSVRLSFLRAGTGTIASTGGSATYAWTVGRLDGCLTLWPDRALRLGGCLRVEGGALDVAGKNIAAAKTQHDGWLAFGALVRGEWSFWGPLALDLGVGPSVRITADHFVFLPGTLVYEVPVLGLSAEAGIGMHFL